ncbi:unnamed protein product [Prorocentrum cordatum]|uniref:Phospholipase B-like n=1 Tax=Prorocentrum cordatum TaxID=2364126 RepID=A0ABN9Y6V9_9DINO|nr:unnamed protein product [Polarella glacialis]
MARLLALAAAGPFPQFGRCAEVKPLSAVDPAELFSVVDNRKEGGTPGWALSEHALPLPTNAWWENLAMAGDTSSPEANVFQMPYVIMADDRGLHAMQPFTTGVTTQGFDKVEALSLSAQEYPKGPRASSWDELGVTLNWPMRDPKQGVKVPLVRGSPYI